MDIALNASFFILGLLVLVWGSSRLVQASIKLSILLKLTPLFIGLILLGFGTSTPEAGIGIMAVLRNQKGIALGNIIGSNISNIGLILGLCAIFRPLNVSRSIFKFEIPTMLFSAILFYLLSLDLLISRLDGVIFILIFILFCIFSYRRAKNNFDNNELKDFKLKKTLKNMNSRIYLLILILISLVAIIIGADFMVRGGVFMAKLFGISPWVIGITVFAIGSSLPELATSLTASFKNIPNISVGNIVGSNIFNILFVLGIVSLIKPISIQASVLKFEFPFLIIFSFVLFTVMRRGYKITRWEGWLMFLGYVLFLVTLIIKQ